MSKYLGRGKTILHIHGAEFHKFYENSSALGKFLIKLSLNYSDLIIVVSPPWIDIVKKIARNIAKPIISIPNGYDDKIFRSIPTRTAREKLGLPLDKIILLSIGHLETYKGHEYLINSMRTVIESRNDIILYIIGSGSLEFSLSKLIENNGLRKHVFLVGGNKPQEEIPLWINSCDIFVLPSLNESFGIVQLEAFACGKPVVATFNGGSESIITSSDYGILANNADSNSLAQCILYALNKQWDSERIINFVYKYRWECIANELINIFDTFGETIENSNTNR